MRMKFEQKQFDSYIAALGKMGDAYDTACESALDKAAALVCERLKAANASYAKFWKVKRAKHNQYGWFAQVQARGKAKRTGERAGFVIAMNEYGASKNRKGEQPARPFVRKTIKESGAEVAKIVEDEFNEELKKLGF